MNRMIICGSPRVEGKSALLSQQLFDACIDDYPDDGVFLASVASLDFEPCIACGTCGLQQNDIACDEAAEKDSAEGEGEGEGDESADLRRITYSCPKDDDMAQVAEALDSSDELIVVCPLYFAGPPAQMKALIDRLQPYFHSDLRHGNLRPAALHVIGDGHSPYGWQPLADILASALMCAGFELTEVIDWTGHMTEDGEIISDADEYAYNLAGAPEPEDEI